MFKDRYIYPAIFDYADDGISIEFPDLPGWKLAGAAKFITMGSCPYSHLLK